MADGTLKVKVRLASHPPTPVHSDSNQKLYDWHWRRIFSALLLVLCVALLLWSWIKTPELSADLPKRSAESVLVTMPADEALPLEEARELQGAGLKMQLPQADVALLPQNEGPSLEAQALVTQATPSLYQSGTGALRRLVLTLDNPNQEVTQLPLPITFSEPTELTIYTEVVGLAGKSIEHRWYYQDKLTTKIVLPVHRPFWRTWSRKMLQPTELHDWRLEILGPDQKLLFSYSLNEK